jgi:hypothetical protein
MGEEPVAKPKHKVLFTSCLDQLIVQFPEQ